MFHLFRIRREGVTSLSVDSTPIEVENGILRVPEHLIGKLRASIGHVLEYLGVEENSSAPVPAPVPAPAPAPASTTAPAARIEGTPANELDSKGEDGEGEGHEDDDPS